MGKKSKKVITEITIEQEQLLLIRKSRRVRIFCRECQGAMVTPEEAVALLPMTTREIYRWVEAGRLHFRETGDGKLYVCLNSLAPKQAGTITGELR
ncbi:MAG TPA: hypothetical protein VNO70_09690 [Blastocatellia bacterium]|nr:hypothetical protein [Blastocatellia bacterium]